MEIEINCVVFCILFMLQIDKEIAKAFSNKPTLKKPGVPPPTAPVAPGLAAPAEPIKGAQKGKLYFCCSISGYLRVIKLTCCTVHNLPAVCSTSA